MLSWLSDLFSRTVTFGDVIAVAVVVPPIIKVLWNGLEKLCKIFRKNYVIKKQEKKDREFQLLSTSLPKDGIIVKGDLRKLIFQFNKPVDRESLPYIRFCFVRINTDVQCNLVGYFDITNEGKTVVWYSNPEFLSDPQLFSRPYENPQAPYIIFKVGTINEWRVKSTDGARLKLTEYTLYLRPDSEK